MEKLLLIMGSLFLILVLVGIYSVIKMSSLCSKDEERYLITVGDVLDIFNEYGFSTVINNGRVDGFIKE